MNLKTALWDYFSDNMVANVTFPTIDNFDESTILRMLRKLIGYLNGDFVTQINEQINNNDITAITGSSDGLSFTIELTKGDGTKIPMGTLDLTDNDNIASAMLEFDTNNRLLSGVLTKVGGTEIEIPAINIPAGEGGDTDPIVSGTFNYSDNQLTLTLNKQSGTNPIVVGPVNIVSGGGGTAGPYPTGISGTVASNGDITLNVAMSEGSPLTGTINMSYFASAEALEDIQAQITAIKLVTTVSQDSTNVIKISNAINGNSADVKLDLSVVGTDIVLTAENSDGTQQAVSKIAVGDIPFEGGLGSVSLSNNTPSYILAKLELINELQTTGGSVNNKVLTIDNSITVESKYGTLHPLCNNVVINDNNNPIIYLIPYVKSLNTNLLIGGSIRISSASNSNRIDIAEGRYKAKIFSIGNPLYRAIFKDIITSEDESSIKHTIENYDDIIINVASDKTYTIETKTINVNGYWMYDTLSVGDNQPIVICCGWMEKIE